ncbi:cyclase family protein [Catellatospora sp. KI3]|uniref:cyclase family protein n=1 Tax=Catellatospora sp. KI3 TaxID=3041620 RepID=UPI002482E313|nr:cyclase family protein [Catellatospora sp. KI3]MDI1462655.1 cyclase family protein [Catellatospora sp. KI3]
MIEYRVSFDADVTFANGGGLQVQEFRLDIPSDSVTDAEVAALLVRHLGLLMVDRVDLRGVEILAEPHKGSRGGPSEPAAPAGAPTRLVELNHVLSEGVVTYPGLPGPRLSDHLSRADSRSHYAPGTEFVIGRVDMVTNTGTYVDSPFHRYADGPDLADLPLSRFADLPVVVARVTGSAERGIGPLAFAPLDVAGRAVLLHTGWDRHFGTDAYGVDAPYLTRAAAEHLIAAGAALVGIDSVNIDEIVPAGERPVHSLLLGAGIPIVEHLTGLDRLPVTGARLHAAPLRFRGLGTFSVRAYALIP